MTKQLRLLSLGLLELSAETVGVISFIGCIGLFVAMVLGNALTRTMEAYGEPMTVLIFSGISLLLLSSAVYFISTINYVRARKNLLFRLHALIRKRSLRSI
jgi:hypothetical protein